MIDRHERIRNRPRFSNADLNLRRHTQTKNATHQDALVTQQQVCSFDTTSDGVGMHVGELDAWLPLHTPHVSPLRFVPLSRTMYSCSCSDVTRPDDALSSAWRRLLLVGSVQAQSEETKSSPRPPHLAHDDTGVVIITLREAHERRQEVLAELHLCGLLPAVRDRAYWYVADRPRTKNGVFGCFRSHVAVANFAQARAWKRFVVVEDDVYVLKGARAGALHDVADVMDMDATVPVVNLSCALSTLAEGPHSHSHNVHPVTVCTSTALMVCSPLYSKLLHPITEALVDVREPYSLSDLKLPAFDYYIFIRPRVANAHAIMPAFAGQRPNGSYITYRGPVSVVSKLIDALSLQNLSQVAALYPSRVLLILVVVFIVLTLALTVVVIVMAKKTRPRQVVK